MHDWCDNDPDSVVSLDVVAICSPHHMDLSSLSLPEDVRMMF